MHKLALMIVALAMFSLPNLQAQAVPIEQDFDGITFVRIDGGEFVFGSASNSSYFQMNEYARAVGLGTQSFWMSKYEISQGEWLAVMGSNPSSYQASAPDYNAPVENISWHDTQTFITKLNDNAGGDYYRLPTEAEWEYVAKAGSHQTWFFGDVLAQLELYAHVNAGAAPLLRGLKLPNAWGIYDLYGNVYEWCEDWYLPFKPPALGACPPAINGNYKVIRGGSNADSAQFLRSSSRQFAKPDRKGFYIGMRLVRVEDPSQDPYHPGTQCTPMPVCGDGLVNNSEQCDDGNLVDGDGCSTSCVIEVPPIPGNNPPNAPIDAPCLQSNVGCPNINWVKLEGGSYYRGNPSVSIADAPDGRQGSPNFLTHFEMSQSKVTVGQYRYCVDAGVCSVPECIQDPSINHWTNAPQGNEQLPINCVTPHQAVEFAKWVGADIPTAAQWEYAARSQGKEQKYPWGNDEPSCDRVAYYSDALNTLCGESTALPVCSRPLGNTEQGLCDMLGNLSELSIDSYSNHNIFDFKGEHHCDILKDNYCNSVAHFYGYSNGSNPTNYRQTEAYNIIESANQWALDFSFRLVRRATVTDQAGLCGNGILDAGEECDDGNITPLDGCSSQCQKSGSLCGNGVLESENLQIAGHSKANNFFITHQKSAEGFFYEGRASVYSFPHNQELRILRSDLGGVKVYDSYHYPPLDPNNPSFYVAERFDGFFEKYDANGELIASGHLIKDGAVERVWGQTFYRDGLMVAANYFNTPNQLTDLPVFDPQAITLPQDSIFYEKNYESLEQNAYGFCVNVDLMHSFEFRHSLGTTLSINLCDSNGEVLTQLTLNNGGVTSIYDFSYDITRGRVTVHVSDDSNNNVGNGGQYGGSVFQDLEYQLNTQGEIISKKWSHNDSHTPPYVSEILLRERCDDGNLIDGDGCSSACQLEVCGNGTLEFGEQCDDANNLNQDGCSATCQIEPEYRPLTRWEYPDLANSPQPEFFHIEGGEVTMTAADGSSVTVNVPSFWVSQPLDSWTYADCINDQFSTGCSFFDSGFDQNNQTEVSWYIANSSALFHGASLATEAQLALIQKYRDEELSGGTPVSSPPPFWDNLSLWALDEWHESFVGYPNDGRAWADSLSGIATEDWREHVIFETSPHNASRRGAMPSKFNFITGASGELAMSVIVLPAEDSVQAGPNGCTWNCEQVSHCGDGQLDLGEECDDGNTYDLDGCSSACEEEPYCGDGTIDPGEACDDGNQLDNDGCDSRCLVTSLPVCGDGTLDSSSTLHLMDMFTSGHRPAITLTHSNSGFYASDVSGYDINDASGNAVNQLNDWRAFNGIWNGVDEQAVISENGLVTAYRYLSTSYDPAIESQDADYFHNYTSQGYFIEKNFNGDVIAFGDLREVNGEYRVLVFWVYDQNGIIVGMHDYYDDNTGYDYDQLPLFDGTTPTLQQDWYVDEADKAITYLPPASNSFDFCQIRFTPLYLIHSQPTGFCNEAGELVSYVESASAHLHLGHQNWGGWQANPQEYIYDYGKRTVTVKRYQKIHNNLTELSSRTIYRFSNDGHLVQESLDTYNFGNYQRQMKLLFISERCDDGNLIDGDGCSSSCQIEMCGNGTLEVGEECDDANNVNEDGCSANCILEAGIGDTPRCALIDPNVSFCPSQQEMTWYTVEGGEVTLTDSFGEESIVNVPSFVYSSSLSPTLYNVCKSIGVCDYDSEHWRRPENYPAEMITQDGQLDWYEATHYGNLIDARLPSEAQLALLMKRQVEAIDHNNDPQQMFIPFNPFIDVQKDYWALDEWHDSLQNMPINGSAWMTRIAGYPIPYYRPRVTRKLNYVDEWDPNSGFVMQRNKFDPAVDFANALYVKPIAHNGVGGMGCQPSEEVCDGIDNDCDGEVDERFPPNCQPVACVDDYFYLDSPIMSFNHDSMSYEPGINGEDFSILSSNANGTIFSVGTIMDMPDPKGEVRAARAGIVTEVVNNFDSSDWGCNVGGNKVVIEHDNGYKTSYELLESVAVSQGDHLNKGQILGYLTVTDCPAYQSPQFSLRVLDCAGNAIDPSSRGLWNDDNFNSPKPSILTPILASRLLNDSELRITQVDPYMQPPSNFPNQSAVDFGVALSYAQLNDTVEIKLIDPTGTVYHTHNEVLDGNYELIYLHQQIANLPDQPGQWTVEYRFKGELEWTLYFIMD